MIEPSASSERSMPPDGAVVVVQLLKGESAGPLEEQIGRLDHPWREFATWISLYEPMERRARLAELIRDREDAQLVLNAINRAQVQTRPCLLDDETPPHLPDGALVDMEAGRVAGQLLDTYIECSRSISPLTPLPFHVSAGLWIVSTVIARRLVVSMPFGRVFPNLFVAWVAPTTIFHKTTAMQLAGRTVRRSFSHLLAAQDSTPESLLADMAGEEALNLGQMHVAARERWEAGRKFAGQRGWILDEMSGLLVRAGRDYNGGLLEMLMCCHDCQDDYVRSTRGQGWVNVKNAYLTLLGASTPDALAPYLAADRYWTGGWWPRFALLAPDVERPLYEAASGSPEPLDFLEGLERLNQQLPPGGWPEPPAAICVGLGAGVADAHERYTRVVAHEMIFRPDLDHRLHGIYGRLPVQVLKVAMILTALEWKTDSPMIEIPHLARAQRIVETWRAGAHRVLARAGAGEYDRIRGRVRRHLSSIAPDCATLRDFCRAFKGIRPDAISDTVRQMMAAGEVESLEGKPGPKGGRPTVKYRLL